MRRGLLTWNAEELPLSALAQRIARLRAAMQPQSLDAIIAYTNISRPAAVSWLSGFTPYWSEGLLMVPREGEICFATALSKRVAEWIATVMPRGEIIPTPQPAIAIGQRLSLTSAKRIGIVNLDDTPARQITGLLAQAPGIEILDVTTLFDSVRGDIDEAERGLVRRAAEIASAAMQHVDPDARTAQELIAPCEGFARNSAAEEIFLSCVPDLSLGSRFQRTDTACLLGDCFALRISLSYKAGWVRVARSFSREPRLAEHFAAAEHNFGALAPPLCDPAAQIAAALKSHTIRMRHWSIEQPRGSYPLVTVSTSQSSESDFRAGSPCTVNVEAEVGGLTWIAARPLL